MSFVSPLASLTVGGTGDVLRNWDAIKKESKHQKSQTEVLQSVAKTLPALMRAQKLRHKAASAAPFTGEECAQDIRTSLSKLESAQTKEEKSSLLGELLFAAAGLADSLGVESEEALVRSCESFLAEFAEREAEKNR